MQIENQSLFPTLSSRSDSTSGAQNGPGGFDAIFAAMGEQHPAPPPEGEGKSADPTAAETDAAGAEPDAEAGKPTVEEGPTLDDTLRLLETPVRHSGAVPAPLPGATAPSPGPIPHSSAANDMTKAPEKTDQSGVVDTSNPRQLSRYMDTPPPDPGLPAMARPENKGQAHSESPIPKVVLNPASQVAQDLPGNRPLSTIATATPVVPPAQDATRPAQALAKSMPATGHQPIQPLAGTVPTPTHDNSPQGHAKSEADIVPPKADATSIRQSAPATQTELRGANSQIHVPNTAPHSGHSTAEKQTPNNPTGPVKISKQPATMRASTDPAKPVQTGTEAPKPDSPPEHQAPVGATAQPRDTDKTLVPLPSRPQPDKAQGRRSTRAEPPTTDTAPAFTAPKTAANRTTPQTFSAIQLTPLQSTPLPLQMALERETLKLEEVRSSDLGLSNLMPESARQTAAQTAYTTAIRMDSPGATARLSDILVAQSGRQIEISLHPAELGKVRMRLTLSDKGSTVIIAADRSDTLDLMRRYADELGDTLRALGHGTVAFDFQSNDQSQPQAEPHASAAPDTTDLPAPDESPVETAAPNSTSKTASTRLTTGGLDIRL